MKRTKISGKLAFARETIATIQSEQLDGIAGGNKAACISCIPGGCNPTGSRALGCTPPGSRGIGCLTQSQLGCPSDRCPTGGGTPR
jgi:hypothetical protein